MENINQSLVRAPKLPPGPVAYGAIYLVSSKIYFECSPLSTYSFIHPSPSNT